MLPLTVAFASALAHVTPLIEGSVTVVSVAPFTFSTSFAGKAFSVVDAFSY